MTFFDAHCHIADVPASVAKRVVCCGTSPDDWPELSALSKKDPRVFPCFGLHPWYAAGAAAGWETKLKSFLLAAPSCVGEIGLDNVKEVPGEEEVFLTQLRLAAVLKRPAVIHCVGNWGGMAELLRAAGLPAFMLHAYGGPAELVAPLAAAGGYFSFGYAVSDPARAKLRAALAVVPRDRLLFESEGALPGSGLRCILDSAAVLLGEPAEELAEITAANGRRFLAGAG